MNWQTLLKEMCNTDPFHTWAIFPDTTHDGKDQWACARIGDSVFEYTGDDEYGAVLAAYEDGEWRDD